MPHPFPPQIKEWLQTCIPPTHKMWWMRTVVLQAQPVSVRAQAGNAILYFRFMVRDVDAPANDVRGYSLDIKTGGDYSDFRPDDRISLFGHEPANATHVSFPRYIFHHDVGIKGPCFQTRFVDSNTFPEKQLYAEKEQIAQGKTKSFWRKMAEQSTLDMQSFVQSMEGGINLEAVYRSLGTAVNELVTQIPDPNYPCVNPRFGNTQGGALVD